MNTGNLKLFLVVAGTVLGTMVLACSGCLVLAVWIAPPAQQSQQKRVSKPVASEISEHPQPQPRPVASKHIQDQRWKLISMLIDDRIVHKVYTDGTCSRVLVLPAFQSLTYDDKQIVVDLCWKWAMQVPEEDAKNRTDFMLIDDAMTNKGLGTYYPSHGLRLKN